MSCSPAVGPDATLAPILPETGTVTVEGCEIRWFAGGSGGPTLVLVHGGGAHSGWWELMLDELTARQRVIALDLGGHGDSGWRPDGYPSDLWVADVAGVIAATASEPVVLVAHSLGGRICTSVAARHPEMVAQLITIDAVVPAYIGEPIPRERPQRFYASEAETLAAFRLMPPQAPTDGPVIERLARRSVRQLADGHWTWKFDPTFPGRMDDRFSTDADIPRVRCPVTIVVGAHSSVQRPNIPGDFVRALGRPAEIISFAGSNHHIPIDAPAELNALLTRLAGPGSP